MARDDLIETLTAEILDEHLELTLGELCRACRVPADDILELVSEGIIEPRGRQPARWRFQAVCIRRVQRAQRLRHDLGVNAPGAALVLDLLDELDELRERLRRLEG